MAKRKGRKLARAEALAVEVDWTTEKRKCPFCGKIKVVDGRRAKGPRLDDFGLRTVRGTVYSQPRCRTCRAQTNYYGQPRKYHTKNNPA